MMPRNDGRIERGQRLSSAFSARAFNRAMDAADVVFGSQRSLAGPGQSYNQLPYTWLYVRNINTSPGRDIDIWDVVHLYPDPEIGPPGSTINGSTPETSKQFENQVLLAGIPGTAALQDWGIAVEPIPVGSIGRVAVGGVVQARIKGNTGNRHSRFVRPTPGDPTALTADDWGDALILWRNWYTPDKSKDLLGVIRFASGSRVAYTFTIDSPWPLGSMRTFLAPGSVYQEGDDSNIEAINTLTTVRATQSNPRKVVVAGDGFFGYTLVAIEPIRIEVVTDAQLVNQVLQLTKVPVYVTEIES